ncbi:complex I intermediate-associated protein 30, mitochondrial [Schistocerca americana]|uniref:complex I intermediate-associated protein 30, mitochondrial n=1 Tax=Schistocerca americana TaxID=7009 RepID=UPI001F4FF47B|nr:complex I intermediate-associated protein 30, mitochondrial [Schistocerca americana]XP_049955341.1 complex I intermediate-associated protein 30, mitochondrial [Schistocerca serialis cubense]
MFTSVCVLLARRLFRPVQIDIHNIRNIYTSRQTLSSFYESDRKSGYTKSDKKVSRLELIRNGLKELKKEIFIWKDEIKEKLESDPILIYRPGETDILWKFDSPHILHQWVTTADSDHKEGYSKCDLNISADGTAVFSGSLSCEVPKDGRIKKSGYCNMKSVRPQKSFKRDAYYNWCMYTHLVLKVRGDGRTYILNLSTAGYYDIMWNDMYTYVLHTRGGPYWQLTKIPFSKFILASKGRLQDKQCPIPLDKVTNVGISLGDKINGPFSLELDYIGLEFDPSHTEEFAYEMYQTPKFLVGS